jgi:hypothetical protein
MISANLKSKQEALNLLDKLQAMGEERKTNKETSLETKQRNFRMRGKKQAGNNRGDNCVSTAKLRDTLLRTEDTLIILDRHTRSPESKLQR